MSVTSFKFLFHLYLGKLNLSTSLQCQIEAVWKRSGQTARSKMIPFSKGSAFFDQTLTLPVNMYFDSNTNSFQQKKSQINFTLHTSKGDKSAGVVVIDLSLMLNNKLEVIQDKLTLDKCPDKNAKIEVKITCESKGENNPSEASAVGILDVTNMSTVSLPGLTATNTEIPLNEYKTMQATKEESEQQPKPTSSETSLQKQNEKLRNQISVLKSKQDKTQSELKKQIQKLNSQIVSIKSELNKTKTSQQSAKKQYQQLKNQHREKDEQYQQAKNRLQSIYQQLQQYI